MEKQFYQEIKESINTNLLFVDIEILDYHKDGELETLTIELPFTTTGNILTYQYNSQKDELLLIDANIYIMKPNALNEEPYIDKSTIIKIYDYCRNRKNYNTKENTTMNENKMNDIYEIIQKGFELTDELLLIYGFNQDEIKKLLEDGILKITEPQKYTLSSVDGLYNYGLNLLSNGKTKKAYPCFKRCIEIQPRHRDAYIQLIYLYLKIKEYNKAYEIIDILYETEDKELQKDTNTYLYLLNLISPCPSKYRQKVNSMESKDLLLEDKDKEENEIRLMIMKDKLLVAINLLNRLNVYKPLKGGDRFLLKELLSQIITANQNLQSQILLLAKEERYNEIIEILSNKSETQRLKLTDEYTLSLCISIQRLIKTKEIPTPTIIDTRDIFEAIYENNFELAEQLDDKYLKEYDINPDRVLTILIRKINEMIKAIKQSKSSSNTEQKLTPESNITANDVIFEILNNNPENAVSLINEYLKLINKTVYLHLISNLIKLSILENDKDFSKPIEVILEIEKDEYNFDLSLYIQEFNSYLTQNKIEEAAIILDIIKKYNQENTNINYNLESSLNIASYKRQLIKPTN